MYFSTGDFKFGHRLHNSLSSTYQTTLDVAFLDRKGKGTNLLALQFRETLNSFLFF